MALDNRLVVYNEQGEPVDYDILASDVKFSPDGKDLPTKLAELEDEIGQGGYAPPQGGIPKTDLAQSVQDSLDKADSALQDEDVAEVAKTGDYDDLQNKPAIPDTSNLATKTELQQGLGNKQDAIVAGNGITIGSDGKTVSVAESIRTGAGKGATAVQSVTVESEEDGTVDIHVDDDTYSINLNHEHQGMAKLAKFVASNPPASMANDTIYVQVDNATSPTEIESIYLFGLEFTGGGLPTGVPQISKPTPNITINLGTAYGQGGSTGTVKIKGRSLTANSTVIVSVSSGFSLSYGQQSGSSINIDAADVILGCDVTVYATAYGTSGTILITSQTDSLSVEANLTSDVVEDLAGVKLTGTQWMQTDYHPNANTEFELDAKFTPNANSATANSNFYFMCCADNAGDDKKFGLYNGIWTSSWPQQYQVLFVNESSSRYGEQVQSAYFSDDDADRAAFVADHAKISYTKSGANGTIQMIAGGVTKSCPTSLKSSRMDSAMKIGINKDNTKIYNTFDLTIYDIKITENGNTVRHYVPKSRNGIPGLYDTLTNTFISSETATELVAIPLT